MTPQQRTLYLKALQNTNGLVLVSGPTGSGKTNTLYAALKHLQQQPLNIVSIEDPIEINLPGVTQINVNQAFGFPDALRTVLRQDPDVIMIGEIRDRETAEMAISAAQTGHLVLASIHASDAYGALIRLEDLGVNLDQAIQQLKVLVSQRLMRITGTSHVSNHSSSRYYSRSGVFDVLYCSAEIQSQLSKANRNTTMQLIIQKLIADTQETSDAILLKLIENNQTDWTEIQRVYGWEKVAKLSSQYIPSSIW
jgi:type II secretory ATPase GspE/PulE/Tfp pilus assembly ATPase PilB-like protein